MKSPRLMINLLTAVYWFDEALRASLRSSGWDTVTRAQSLLLANITAGEHRASRLAHNLGVSPQAISQMLSELESRGLIEVAVDPEDRRARIVTFSTKSTTLRNAAHATLNQLEKELRSRLGARKFQGLHDALLTEWGKPPTSVRKGAIQPPPDDASAEMIARPRQRLKSATPKSR